MKKIILSLIVFVSIVTLATIILIYLGATEYQSGIWSGVIAITIDRLLFE